ncbi:MAG: phosphomethylpyrimidine synthase ThiC [Nocardia sp.]|nr:phosphomethylpyrimidine synthase ThiC [Nocardia sp.]
MSALTTDPQFIESCVVEGLDPEDAAIAVTTGQLVFLRSAASRTQDGYAPLLVGAGTRRKISALIGLGPKDTDRDKIVQTMSVILAARPDAVMDLTTNPEALALRRDLKEVMGVPLGACVTYDLFTDPRKKLSRNEFLERFEQGLAGGVDFVLAHFGMNPVLAEMMRCSNRIMPTTSRGGGLIDRYMRIHRCDNPLLEYLDGIIDICRRLEVVVDLGDIFRPGATADAGDEMKWAEIGLLAEVRKQILAGGVQVLCESGGHIPLHRIGELIPAYKEALGDAPLWLAGPMVIDNAVSLDSVVNTIGIAAACWRLRRRHVRLYYSGRALRHAYRWGYRRRGPQRPRRDHRPRTGARKCCRDRPPRSNEPGPALERLDDPGGTRNVSGPGQSSFPATGSAHRRQAVHDLRHLLPTCGDREDRAIADGHNNSGTANHRKPARSRPCAYLCRPRGRGLTAQAGRCGARPRLAHRRRVAGSRRTELRPHGHR